MYKEFKVDLTHAQAMKVLHGKPIRLSAAQLGKGHAHYFHPENHKKLVKAFENHKGVTLHMEHGEVLRTHQSGLSGSGFWGKLWSGIKKIGKFAKDSGLLSMLADKAIPAAATALGEPELAVPVRAGLQSLTGVGLKEDLIHQGKKTFHYAKKKGIITDAIDTGEKFLISKTADPGHHEMIKSVRRGVRAKYGVGLKSHGVPGASGSFRLS